MVYWRSVITIVRCGSCSGVSTGGIWLWSRLGVHLAGEIGAWYWGGSSMILELRRWGMREGVWLWCEWNCSSTYSQSCTIFIFIIFGFRIICFLGWQSCRSSYRKRNLIWASKNIYMIWFRLRFLIFFLAACTSLPIDIRGQLWAWLILRSSAASGRRMLRNAETSCYNLIINGGNRGWRRLGGYFYPWFCCWRD